MRTKYIYYIFTITNQSIWEGEGGAIQYRREIEYHYLFLLYPSVGGASIATYSLTVVSVVDNAAED